MEVLEDKKGENIVLLDLQGQAIFADYFIICSGTSDRMLQALADALVDEMRPILAQKPRLEGSARDGWLLVDLGDIIAHVFTTDRRNYYRLEDLWSEAKVLIHLQ